MIYNITIKEKWGKNSAPSPPKKKPTKTQAQQPSLVRMGKTLVLVSKVNILETL